MTRETKVGLLVGLAFIIIVGILLSEPLSHSNEAQPAQLPVVGNNVRSGVTTPGSGQPAPITIVDSHNVTPRQPVPLQGELTNRGQNGGNSVISIGGGNGGQSGGGREEIRITAPPGRGNGPLATGNRDNPTTGNGGIRLEGDHAGGSIDIGNTLSNGGRRGSAPPRDPNGGIDVIRDGLHNGELVQLDGRGQPMNNGGGRAGNPLPAGSKQYTAAAGDSLSKIASKAYGNNGKAYRDAIVAANPSLQQDANKIIAGRTYVIPVVGAVPAPTGPSIPPAPTRTAAGNTPAGGGNTPAPAGYVYTVKESDSLWKIARDVVGDAGAVAAIKELNKEALAGGDQVRPNMKLRLPSKPIASTN